MSIIAVEKDAPGATSQLAAAANPDNIPTVEDLCVACKEGSSGSHPLTTKVVSMIENDDDATNQLPTPTSVASCVITLHSLIREDNQDTGPSAFQPITGSQPFLTFPAIQEISTSKEILSLEIPPLNMLEEIQAAGSEKTLPQATLNENKMIMNKITLPVNNQTTDPLPDCVITEVVREAAPTPGPSRRSKTTNEMNVQREAQEDDLDISENRFEVVEMALYTSDLINKIEKRSLGDVFLSYSRDDNNCDSSLSLEDIAGTQPLFVFEECDPEPIVASDSASLPSLTIPDVKRKKVPDNALGAIMSQKIHLSPIFIDNEQASLIIGYEGQTICDIRKTSEATLIVSPPLEESKRHLTLEGSSVQVTSALNGIFSALQMKYESEDDALPTLYNFPRYPRPPAVSEQD